MKYFSYLAKQTVDRSKESSLGVLGITDSSLRQHLSANMSSSAGEGESFLADPVFEHTFGWQASDISMEDLEGDLLNPSLVNALDQAVIVEDGGKKNNRYQFDKRIKPYIHQLDSWKTLIDQKKSVVVTSGTGSGKTECFMIPVLDDLYREYEKTRRPLVGVRALFLYPLNALINSQRERLQAWTQASQGGVRYCLYNGNTEERAAKVSAKQKKVPNEIFSRELLREEPSPILVTNGTMLEYMLVRQIDAPIIQKSKENKTLRWIVLDEAHSYVGSQAAELSLLLQRVLIAFGVESKDVRFVATSATIAGDDAEKQLQEYLASVADIDPSQVVVIGGKRNVPELTSENDNGASLSEILRIDAGEEVSSERFDALSRSKVALALREILTTSKMPMAAKEILTDLQNRYGISLDSLDSLLQWVDVCCLTKNEASAEAFLKLRAHFFQRMMYGLWSCIDGCCTHKQGTHLEKGWDFGFVYSKQRSRCECGSPVFEVTFCHECNTPHLLAKDAGGFLKQFDTGSGDEFTLLSEQEEGDEDVDFDAGDEQRDCGPSTSVYISKQGPESAEQELDWPPVSINLTSGKVSLPGPDCTDVFLNNSDQPTCVSCGFSGYGRSGQPFKRSMLGAPFYVMSAVPTVLEFCQDYEPSSSQEDGPNTLPGRGRRLITFTDSRQGTARMAVSMQQDAERSRLRGLVVNKLREAQLSMPKSEQASEDADIEKLTRSVKDLRDSGLNEMADMVQAQIDALLKGEPEGSNLAVMSWSEMIDKLKISNDVKGPIYDYNRSASPALFDNSQGVVTLAEILLLREFSRRPKRTNNLETMGLVKLVYPQLEKVTTVPKYWESNALNLRDWKDFLKVALDFYVRENMYLRFDAQWRSWIGFHFSSKLFRAPDSEEKNERNVKKWVQLATGQYHRLVKLLMLATRLDPTRSAVDSDIINDWLKAAWKTLTTGESKVLSAEGNLYFLERDAIHFSFLDKAYVCPVTNKIIDTSFKQLTPYIPKNFENQNFTCKEVTLPKVWRFSPGDADYDAGIQFVRQQVGADIEVTELRNENLWTNQNDRVVEGGFYYRTAEHSAQQSATNLQAYEELFKKGKVNVLNCSTTMEMGVDIGGISAVVMNNVPPHPANYLQRAGRAGRSKESVAISYTLCKDNPHDQQVFANPSWPFTTTIPAPHVTFSSDRLVQRHVNSLLLSEFLRINHAQTDKEKTNLTLEWFFAGKASVASEFKIWLQSSEDLYSAKVKRLVRGTALEGCEVSYLVKQSSEGVSLIEDSWSGELKKILQEQQKAKPDSAYAFRIEQERKRHCNEYLLKELAAGAYLPGYGFPTDLVSFDNFNLTDYIQGKAKAKSRKQEREDNLSRVRGLPSRNLAIAIREYSPGSEIVLDGRVFKSAGVSLHWKSTGGEAGNEAQEFMLAWRCEVCGQQGVDKGIAAVENLCCSNCGAEVAHKNKKTVLKPSGFLSDFYAEPSNDISHRAYVPVNPSWVSVTGERLALPNSELGSMHYGPDGSVFHHSSGLYGEGYAVCMKCGRSDSMLPSGEYPEELSPDRQHRPLKGSPFQKDESGRVIYCDGHSHLKANIHLGCQSKTDVFELVLRNPVTKGYISDFRGQTVDWTIAVALRQALADKLGISTSELGYSTRPSKLESGENIRVIQLFDTVSGGAGFATNAAYYIQSLLKDMVDMLSCGDGCETACSSCLLDSETRHDASKLDRLAALDWLGSNFKDFIELDEADKVIDGAQFCSEPLLQFITRHQVQGVRSLRLVLNDDSNEWDLKAHNFRRRLISWYQEHQANLELCIPNTADITTVIDDLRFFRDLGVSLSVVDSKQSKPFIAQMVLDGDEILSIASSTDGAKTPNQSWLKTSETVVYSTVCGALASKSIDPNTFNLSKGTSDSRAIEITNEMNERLTKFGQRFWDVIISKSAMLKECFDQSELESVEYSDRYLQAPLQLLLVSEVMANLPQKTPNLRVHTFFKPDTKYVDRIIHNWGEEQVYREICAEWLKAFTDSAVAFDIETNRRDIPHRRVLTLTFNNKRVVRVRFDQGFGYWEMKYEKATSRFRYFDFSSSIHGQVMSLMEARKNINVSNSASWSTDIFVSVESV